MSKPNQNSKFIFQSQNPGGPVAPDLATGPATRPRSPKSLKTPTPTTITTPKTPPQTVSTNNNNNSSSSRRRSDELNLCDNFSCTDERRTNMTRNFRLSTITTTQHPAAANLNVLAGTALPPSTFTRSRLPRLPIRLSVLTGGRSRLNG